MSIFNQEVVTFNTAWAVTLLADRMAIMRWLSAARLAIQTIVKHACFLDGQTWAIYLLSGADTESQIASPRQFV